MRTLLARVRPCLRMLGRTVGGSRWGWCSCRRPCTRGIRRAQGSAWMKTRRLRRCFPGGGSRCCTHPRRTLGTRVQDRTWSASSHRHAGRLRNVVPHTLAPRDITHFNRRAGGWRVWRLRTAHIPSRRRRLWWRSTAWEGLHAWSHTRSAMPNTCAHTSAYRHHYVDA